MKIKEHDPSSMVEGCAFAQCNKPQPFWAAWHDQFRTDVSGYLTNKRVHSYKIPCTIKDGFNKKFRPYRGVVRPTEYTVIRYSGM